MSNDLPPTTDQQNDALHRADVARIIAWNPTLQSGRAAHLGPARRPVGALPAGRGLSGAPMG